jgi:hypothetical protein
MKEQGMGPVPFRIDTEIDPYAAPFRHGGKARPLELSKSRPFVAMMPS